MSIDPPTEATNHKAKLVSGALWAVGTRWTTRLLSLASTVILARILQQYLCFPYESTAYESKVRI